MTELKYYCDKCKKEMKSTDKQSEIEMSGLPAGSLLVHALICEECKEKLHGELTRISIDNMPEIDVIKKEE